MDSDLEKPRTRSERIARIISLLTISPFQIVVYMAFADIICNTILQEFLLNTISGVFYLLIPFIPLIYIIRKKNVRNASIPVEDRFHLFPIQISGFVGASLVYFFYQNFAGLDAMILFVFTVGYTILTVICFIITMGLKFKISLHMTGAASSITALIIILGGWWGLLYLFCIPIAWARVKVEAHTELQVLSGTILGIATIFLTFLCFGYII